MSRAFAGGVSTDRVDLAVYGAIDNLDLLTVAVWTYRTGEGGNDVGRIVSSGTAQPNNAGWDLLNRLAGDTTGFNATRWPTAGNWSVPRPAANEWHHIVVAYDYGSASNVPAIYNDAVAQTVTPTQSPSGTKIAQNETHLAIGNRPSTQTATRAYDGRIAEVGVWNRVLSADEIKAVYSSGVLAVPSGLVLYVPMIGDASPEPNYYNGAGNATVQGTTVADHPPVRSMLLGRKRRVAKIVGQFARPIADLTDGSWLNQAGSGTNLYASVDEAAVDDADYIQSGASPVDDACELGLGDLAVAAAGTWTARVRLKKV